VILATLDGLAFQVALDPDAVDVNAVFELLFGFVRDTLQAAEGGSGASRGDL